jgi:hypothetical protein
MSTGRKTISRTSQRRRSQSLCVCFHSWLDGMLLTSTLFSLKNSLCEMYKWPLGQTSAPGGAFSPSGEPKYTFRHFSGRRVPPNSIVFRLQFVSCHSNCKEMEWVLESLLQHPPKCFHSLVNTNCSAS